jgi:hypothetical protein
VVNVGNDREIADVGEIHVGDAVLLGRWLGVRNGSSAPKFYSWGLAGVAVSLKSPEIHGTSVSVTTGKTVTRSGKYQEPKEANSHQRQGNCA